MKNIQQWLDAYGVSHQNKTNKMIHWICVPLIMFSLLGILSLVKITVPIFASHYCINIAHLAIYIAIFVGAWIGQFIGHKIEGQKPSFFEDLQFLLIGPAWLLSFIYNKMGIKY